MRIIVVGINTEVGKTVVSAILTRMLNAEYWKFIQAGSLDNTDSSTVNKLSGAYCHPEAYRFKEPLSPHQAAKIDNITIETENFRLPQTSAPLIIETTGGFLSPCAQKHLQGDIFASWPCSWLLVSRAYLGSINHTFLTLEALRSRNLNILGMILNGYSEEERSWMVEMTDLSLLGSLHQEQEITPRVVQHYANNWREPWSHNQKFENILSGTPFLNMV
ncbi:dethiobiotin synthase [Chlamydia sp. 17-3921]|uniref:dethiobiotin synthase n=1 Tax=Chlamydia sp. 17-3921 TaxID=2675798 RepID=UPI001918C855|nr:dethiobiotin synthase [Chlamydia sp. 17-3921]